ncbi:MAG: winged helix-turn-helix transcriptional regulator [Chloroflexi bacterium AL-W]|nr:winged helix-turn-helix transcriptional regulator [Chloroflexi bacterium AL-N1]NOK66960.1 winged helix-turn-helix transcriptional regulator [Chloroflexi bacterium AL-N10]NOK74748.1 winged helix-turn-helix transcriptional regulator [Chloroflexi bacterium AL-N5]NOK81562.1 winged helix-turn-helix transcriptional regulator [Chloroflexi bacterium AL-W]NOK89032.1 winged helix-turn-helix transcriptional regulator [Chloroflexi bacterium AL-N15]
MLTAYREHDDERIWRVFKALGNPVRLQIVRFIQQHPYCICNEILLQLPNECIRAQSTLSQHLKVLREADVIRTDCDGTSTSYVVNDEFLDWVRGQLDELVEV